MGKIIIKNEADNKKYELEYNRSAIVRMEKQGFDVKKIDKEPIATIVLLMRGAFYMHNPSLSDEEIDAICDKLDKSDEFIQALLEIYTNALMALSGQDKKQAKNFKWEKC